MDRYWITRVGDKVAIPSKDDIEKFSKVEEPKPMGPSVLNTKADLCARIIKLQYPHSSQKQLVSHASTLMHKSVGYLLRRLEKLK
jgi:hypothetical protein